MSHQTGKAYCVVISVLLSASDAQGAKQPRGEKLPSHPQVRIARAGANAEPGAARSRRAELKMRGAQERAIGFGFDTPERSPDCGASPEPGHGWTAEGSGGVGPESEMRTDLCAPRRGDHRPAGCGMNGHRLSGPTFLFRPVSGKERWEITF
jgi:hypothetical protein